MGCLITHAAPQRGTTPADALNRYTAVGAVTPTYDNNSNLAFDGTFNFGYDAENRLTSASGAGNTRKLCLRRAGPAQDQDGEWRNDRVRHRRRQSPSARI